MKKNLLFILLLWACALNYAMAQSRTISGKVVGSDDGLPVAGATVRVPNTSIGAPTNANGNFSLNVPSGTQAIQVSYIGYVTQTVNIGNRSVVTITLQPDIKQINEVVVTGYTTTSRSKSTGATGKVTAAQINDVPVASFDQIIQGRVPGLSVLAGSGQPGATANVYVRGYTSISGSTTPLYIIDGIPVESSVFSTLNPNDFESVDILKDAAATSLYGSRGANGVLVITTKRGKSGRTVFTYDAQGGFSDRSSTKFDMLSGSEQIALQRTLKLGPGYTLSPDNPNVVRAKINGVTTTLTAAQKAQILDSISNINTKWDDLFFRRGTFQSHQLSASGGNDNTRFYTALSYYQQQGIAKRSSLNRYNLRFNLDHTSGKLKLGLQSGLGFSRSSFIESEAGIALANPFAAAYLGLPYEKPYDAAGNVITTGSAGSYPFSIFDNRIGANALARIDATGNRSNQIKETVGLNGSYEFFKGFTARTTLGLDFRETSNESTVYPNTYAGSLSVGNQGSYTTGNTRNLQLIQTSGLQYLNNIGKHEVFATVLSENIRNRFSNIAYTGYGINPALLNTPAGITPGTSTNNFIPLVSGGKTQNGINSFIGIFKDTYDDKYTVQLTGRRDGSSQVPVKNRWHNYFSVSANWNAKNENFLKDVSWIDVLRVRGSYGTTATPFGTTNTSGNFGYLPLFGATSYAGTPGIAPTTPGNPEYDWEFTAQTDFGIDFSFLKNRVRTVIDVYQKNTNNLFVSQQLSATSGFTSVSVNAGKMRNKGIEVSLEGDVVKSQDWLVTLTGNFAYNKNLITSLGQVNQFESGTSIIRVGLPLGSHYAVKSAGVDPQTGQYLYYNRDGSITNVYNAATQNVAEYGTYIAPISGGFGFNASYKGIYLNSTFVFFSKFKRFNNQDFFLTNPANVASYGMESVVNTVWTTPGQVTTIGAVNSQRQFNSVDVQDASYLRLRNLQLGYALPGNVVKRLKYVSGVRFFAQGQNLATWTKWTGFDPEDSNNIASFEYPTPRTYTFGLTVTF